MVAIKPLISHLARPNVTEVALRSNQRPAARINGDLDDIDKNVLSSDDVLQLLFAAGGSRYLETIGEKPVQWRTRVEGIGTVLVTAVMHGDSLEAHLAVHGSRGEQPAVRLTSGPASVPTSPNLLRPAGNETGSREGPETRPSNPAYADDLPPSARPTPSARPVPSVRSAAFGEPPPSARPTPSSASAPSGRPTFSSQVTPTEPRAPSLPQFSPVSTDKRNARTKPHRPPSPSEMEFDLGLAQELTPRNLPALAAPPSSDNEPSSQEVTVRRPEPIPKEGPSAKMTSMGLAPMKFDDLPTGPASPITPSSSSGPGSLPPPLELDAEVRPTVRRPTTTPPPTPEPGFARRRTTRPFVRDPGRVGLRRWLQVARSLRASDLHLIAGRPPQFRVAGKIEGQGDALSARQVEDMMLPRVPPRMVQAFSRDGACDFALEEEGLGRFRVHVGRQREGLKASFRLIGTEIPPFASLGLPEAVEAAIHQHHGLIVVTGPVGQGKTTTLASLVDLLNTKTTRHILTIEDPVEYVHAKKHALVRQREVGTHTHGFCQALRASLREDPDVVVVSELRDVETVRLALLAAESGHLVLGTMNASSAAKTVDRLIDLFPSADQAQTRTILAGTLRLIIGQRVVPTADGHGVVVAAEILPGSVPLWHLIRDGRTYQIPSLQTHGKAVGIVRLDESLAELVRRGSISAQAAREAAEMPDDLDAALGHGKGVAAGIPRVGAVTVPVPANELKPSDGARGESGRGLFERAGALFGKKGN